MIPFWGYDPPLQLHLSSSLPVSPSLRSFTKTPGFFMPVSSSPCSLIDPSSSIRQKTPVKHFLTCWWPWPLAYDLDLWMWPRYPSTWSTHQKSGPYICLFGRESGNIQTHRQTDRHTDDVKTSSPVADTGCNDSAYQDMHKLNFSTVPPQGIEPGTSSMYGNTTPCIKAKVTQTWWPWPMTLTFELDLGILLSTLTYMPKTRSVCLSVCLWELDRHTDRHTEWQLSELLHPLLMLVVIKHSHWV